MQIPKKTILYVEDEESDIFLMGIALKRGRVDVALHTVRDGESALRYLSGAGDFSDRERHPFPDLVLLDLNIPRVHGLKVLKWIREQPGMTALPVVIYTSSEQPKDVAAAQELQANDYQVKPSTVEHIAEKVRAVIRRFLG
jgi:CheY-like chemotaxis protein